MPNKTGGKKYKQGKHTEDKIEFHEIDEAEGQTVGRIVKNLGDRNMLVYCNDTKERICRIRGSMSKKKCRLETGDIVLISLREELAAGKSGKEHGDILAKYVRETFSQLKKLPGINPILFQAVEQADYKQRATGNVDDEDFFEAGETTDEENSEEDEETKAKKREERDRKRNEARNVKEATRAGEDDDLNIDDI